MVNKRTVVDGNLDGTGGKKKTMQQKLGDNISGGPALSTAKRIGQGVNKLSERAQAELKRLRDIQNKKNRVRGASNAGVNDEAAGVATEDPVARMKRATGQTGLKKGGMAKKGYKKGGMAKKGYAMGGMMKKGYSKGGAMKKKGYKKGGKVRGAGIASKGVRAAKIVKMKGS